MAKDYYAILSLTGEATPEQIRKRFLQLARSKHPDRFSGEAKVQAESEFQKITEAFNVLRDPERRRQHDVERDLRVDASASDYTQVAKTFVQRGGRAYREGRFADAAAEFERAVQLNETNAAAWYRLALAYSHQPQNFSKGLKAVVKACELDKMNPRYLKLAGRLFAESGMPLRAERYYQQALRWAGQDPELREELERLKMKR